ncbi:MAG: AIR synthase family protein [Clostridium sp.]
METGKLNFDVLNNLINNNKGNLRDEVIVRNTVGEDCAVINFGGHEGIFSTDPITGASANVGRLAVHINCNDLASAGAEPIALLVTILAPVTSSLEDIERVMNEISEEAKRLNVEIVGGHTEVTEAVNKMVISITAIGKNASNKVIKTAGAEVGDDIIVTKFLGIEGTSILINDHEGRLKKILSEEEIKDGKELINYISVVKEGRIASEFGVNSMHDITEGGVLGALFELSSASNTGFEIEYDSLPILNITKKVCNEFKIDPLGLISSGSMLITTKNGEKLVERLNLQGINSKVIGKITSNDKVIIKNDERQMVQEPKRDELFNIK